MFQSNIKIILYYRNGTIEEHDGSGLLEQQVRSVVTNRANGGERNDSPASKTKFLSDELPAGFNLTVLHISRHGKTTRRSQRKLHMDTSSRVSASPGNLDGDLRDHFDAQNRLDSTLNVSDERLHGLEINRSADIGLDGDETASLSDGRVSQTHGGRNAEENIDQRSELVHVDAGLTTNVTLNALAHQVLNNLLNGMGSDGQETLVVVHKVDVDEDLRLAGSPGFDLQILVDLLQFRVDMGRLVLVGRRASSGLAEQHIDELLGLLAVDGDVSDTAEIGASVDVEAVILVGREERLEAGEADRLGHVAQTRALLVAGLHVVGRDVGSPAHGLHHGQNGFGALSNITALRILVGNQAAR